jgi:uncharacterized repeat protein (TIGR02543 family)
MQQAQTKTKTKTKTIETHYSCKKHIKYYTTYSGGTAPEVANPSEYAQYNDEFTLNNPTPKEETEVFAGWTCTKDGYAYDPITGASTKTKRLEMTIPKNSEGNFVFTAQWEKKQSIIVYMTYETYGYTITNTPASDYINTHSTYKITEQTPQATSSMGGVDLTFKEWNTKPNGTGKRYVSGEETTITEALILYAIFMPSQAIPIKSLGSIYTQNMGSGEYIVTVAEMNETYAVKVTNYYEDITYNENPTIETTQDGPMVIEKYHKNLTIEEGVTLTPSVRTKGFAIYVKGTLTNNGTISMTARGASAAGQDVYLWEDNAVYETVPAVGASGGAAIYASSGASIGGNLGNVGATSEGRATGGGGSGTAVSYYADVTSGRGGKGTSYSGGSGGGAIIRSLVQPRLV